MQTQSQAFEDDIVKAVVPFVDSVYRTIPDRDHRAMAGLSMGGMQAFQVALNHMDVFAYLGGFSGAPFFFGGNKFNPKTEFNGVYADPAAFAKKMHLLWLGVGSKEMSMIHQALMTYHDGLVQAGIKHVFYQSPGTAYEWLTWRRDLNDFAPRLFRSVGK